MPSRLRMLMVSPAAPWPATTGGLVRIEAILRQMARHFDVTFVSPRRVEQVLPRDLPVRFVCPPIGDPGASRKLLAAVDPARPFHAALYGRPELKRVVADELSAARYDVVYSHFIYGVQFLRECPAPVVVDQQNVDREYWQNKADHSRFPLNWYSAWNTRRTVRYETRVLPGIWAYVSVSDEDRVRTRAYAKGRTQYFWVAPNGVDTHRFTPAMASEIPAHVITLGYLGSMDLEMNIEAVTRFMTGLLPRIRQAMPERDVRFVVIGRNPAPSIEAIAQRMPGITLSGTVDDVVPWLQRLDVLVSPLRIGAGTKLKVAEAMSCALPVVGSALAFAGLSGRSGEHFLQADSDDDFVAAVCRLARSRPERMAVGRKAREFTETHLEWDRIGDRLAADIREALGDRGGRRHG